MAASSLPEQTPDLQQAYRRLREFRQGRTGDRLFIHPTCHPAEPTGFCYCEGSTWRALRFYAKALLLGLAFRVPVNGLKVWMLRRLGARVGRQVYFSPGVWVDPTFPELITIEDGVFFGLGAKIFTHEFRIDQFRAGKVLIRRGAFVGGFAIIGCGVEIGERAVVAACSVADRDVPAGATLIQSPARILRRPEAP
ncbi:MAG: acyltransferase [Thermoguttaceae bacterium]|jgi:acetyltransferase-like isoleucine patch superfamily enzyme